MSDAILIAVYNAKAELDWMALQAKLRINARFDAWEAERATPRFMRGVDWGAVRAKAAANASAESVFGKALRERRELLDSFRL